MAGTKCSRRHVGPKVGDAFGAMMVGASKGRAATGFLERDDGLITALPSSKYEVLDVVDRTACGFAEGSILDIGAGSGRHAREFADAGHDVVAIDTSPGCVGLLSQLQRIRGRLGTVSEYLASSDATVVDSVVLLGNNLGLAGLTADLSNFLYTCGRALRPGGLIIGTSVIDPRAVDDINGVYAGYNRLSGRDEGDRRIRFRYGTSSTEWGDYALVPPNMAWESLTRAGFREPEFDYCAPYYVIRARKS